MDSEARRARSCAFSIASAESFASISSRSRFLRFRYSRAASRDLCALVIVRQPRLVRIEHLCFLELSALSPASIILASALSWYLVTEEPCRGLGATLHGAQDAP